LIEIKNGLHMAAAKEPDQKVEDQKVAAPASLWQWSRGGRRELILLGFGQ
jgi:hypothetical protein